MDQPRILVIDLRHDAERPDTLSSAQPDCVSAHVCSGDNICHAISSVPLHALCFEYDYPDIPNLMLFKDTKLAHPSIPAFMITRQHSESLAVWALRSGVWDYFVTPVPAADLRKCLDSLAQLPVRGADERSRHMVKHSAALPAETRFRGSCPPQEHKELEHAIEYVERNLSSKIAQSAVARECQMSIWQFSRQFRKCFGTTFQEYIQHRRMMEAVKLLKNPSASVTDVCFAVGFIDPSYFTRVFRRYVGMSPSCYKDQIKEVSTTLQGQAAPALTK